MANIYYKGDEVKFSINLTAPGFSMDEDDFDIEVSTPKASVKASKGAPTDDLRIFREPELDSSSDNSDSNSSEEPQSGTWYAIVDTAKLGDGEMRVFATAHIKDAHANDYVRNQTAVTSLGTLRKL